jgi:two-component sensor histidine kinase
LKQGLSHIVIIMLLFLYNESYGQKLGQYNLSMSNGLPSNHVYGLLKDRYGYLWIATERGAVKYNGYEFKTFGMQDGIANDDIWKMYEDSKGRIWLGNISHEIGYIYRDRYHKMYINDADPQNYATYISENAGKNAVIFSKVVSGFYWKIFVERNDTLQNQLHKKFRRVFLIPHGNALLYDNDSFYKYNLQYPAAALQPVHKNNYDYLSWDLHTEEPVNYTVKKWLVSYYPRSLTIHLLNTDNFSDKTLTLDSGEYMINGFGNIAGNYLVSNKKVYKFDDEMNAKGAFLQNELVRDSSFNGTISYVMEDSFWNTYIATNANGIYINYKASLFNRVKAYDLSGYKYVGNAGDSIQYAWNKSTRKLAIINAADKINYIHCPGFYNITKISPFKASKILIFADGGLFYSEKNDISGKRQLLNAKVYLEKELNGSALVEHLNMKQRIADAVVNDTNDVYVVSQSGDGLLHLFIRNDTCICTYLFHERLTAICDDPLRNAVCAYNSQDIVIYSKTEHKTISIKNSALNAAGIRKIESITIDNKYGNIFIKDYDRLYCYDVKKFTLKGMFANCRLGRSIPYIHMGKLVVAGQFGTLHCDITGAGRFSNIVMQPNTKNVNFDYVNDAFPVADKIFLNTDKGIYSAPISTGDAPAARSAFNKNSDYKFIVSYKDSVRNLLSGDSILLDQPDHKLRFDVINPHGKGTLKFKYHIQNIDSTWQQLDSKELFLNGLQPDNYYTVSVIASDDAWQSKMLDIKVYVIPYWWQTVWGKRTIGVLSILFTLSIILLVVYTTKRVVTKKHLKRSHLLEVELKSIYSQINPHFIFNTLNTGLYFIQENKMPEAYGHIAAFSDLLRSYIKSSRNKFVVLAEEIENLDNYIVLQQARFEDKFDYKIAVDKEIDVNSVYIPALLLQPVVENAINHGLLNKEGKGHLKIEFKRGGADGLICIIDDNGIGRERSRLLNEQDAEKNESFGTDLVKELIDIFNAYEMMDIQINYFDKVTPLMGTTVTLTIKDLDNGRKI